LRVVFFFPSKKKNTNAAQTLQNTLKIENDTTKKDSEERKKMSSLLAHQTHQRDDVEKGKLTVDVILESNQTLNAVDEYELDLSSKGIKAIENLGGTNDQFDCIDVSKNEIVKLEGFPKLKRLHTINASENKIEKINGTNLSENVPKLEWLLMQNNKIKNLHDIDEIGKVKRLKCLVLKGNPVCAVENYRLYCIYKLNDGLRMLDYERVYAKEREAAKKMFEGDDGKAIKAKTFTVGKRGGREEEEEDEGKKKKGKKNEKKNNAAELAKIKAAIANATTLEEIAMLEKAMETGVLPSEYK
jgi:U2 small nuclear ribonucleoprotein A'